MTKKIVQFLSIITIVVCCLALTSMSGCATLSGSGMVQCRNLCSGSKVESYKDDVQSCMCNVSDNEQD